ncbi:MAG: hypothetical protein AAF497_13250, partial [Planctomycetota bacterium]
MQRKFDRRLPFLYVLFVATAFWQIPVDAAQVSYRPSVTDLSGNTIDSISVGSDFYFKLYVDDLRTEGATGVFSAFADVTFDSTLVSAVDSFVYSPQYPNAQSGTVEDGRFVNAGGLGGIGEARRAGHGTHGGGAIFVRGSQPIIVDNQITGTEGTQSAVINIDVNSLNAKELPDYGRSRGELDRFELFDDNQGPLVRENIVDHNSVNGIREYARTASAKVTYAPVHQPDLRVDEDELVKLLAQPNPNGNNLFAYPAQSNFSGVQHPLTWIEEAQSLGWDVL